MRNINDNEEKKNDNLWRTAVIIWNLPFLGSKTRPFCWLTGIRDSEILKKNKENKNTEYKNTKKQEYKKTRIQENKSKNNENKNTKNKNTIKQEYKKTRNKISMSKKTRHKDDTRLIIADRWLCIW